MEYERTTGKKHFKAAVYFTFPTPAGLHKSVCIQPQSTARDMGISAVTRLGNNKDMRARSI